MINPDDLETVNFTLSDTIRLISTAYIDEPALSPLVDDEDDLRFIEEIEGLTSSRRGTGIPIPPGVVSDELLTEKDGYGWTYVNAAFCYTRSTGNRFNGPNRGAWYAAWGVAADQTALAEVSWHLTRELEATGVFENTTSYRELIAGFTSQFHDLRSVEDAELFSEDPQTAYPVGQTLAQAILRGGGNGVVYPSVRRSGGLCAAAFRPRLIQNIRQGNTWLLKWSGNPAPEMSLM